MPGDLPLSHPRRASLLVRDRIVAGAERGITSWHGLIAQGRGEAFDYLLGETTHSFAIEAIEAAAALLVRAKHPVLSVNGNVAALAAGEMIRMGALLDAPLEVNIFHSSKSRERAIRDHLISAGARSVLLPTRGAVIDGVAHNRRFVNPAGIGRADVVFVPLEDGDRCQALGAAGKLVVTVDLNPLSRTARTAAITIVDNLVRCLPLLIERIRVLQAGDPGAGARILSRYRNDRILARAEKALRGGRG